MTILIVALIAVLLVIGVVSFRKRVTKGCCESSDDSSVTKVDIDDHPDHYTCSAKVHIEGMHCANCIRKIENAYASNGCLAKIDLNKKEAVVYMKKKLPDELLTAIPERIGYDAQIE